MEADHERISLDWAAAFSGGIRIASDVRRSAVLRSAKSPDYWN
jgi:hypothetical protein